MGQVIAILRELKISKSEHAVKLRDEHSKNCNLILGKWDEINETFLEAELKRQDDPDFGNTKQVSFFKFI